MNVITIRPLDPAELNRLGEIDRTETIRSIYVQQGEALLETDQPFDVPPWSPTGSHPHSVPDQIAFCEWHVAQGAAIYGALADERLVGIGLVTPHIRSGMGHIRSGMGHIRPGIAQLAYLHVGHGYRGRGVGRQLVAELERVARAAGDTEMVVSATPTVRTVRFYMSCGFAPMAEPLPELFAKEPEDIHLSKRLN